MQAVYDVTSASVYISTLQDYTIIQIEPQTTFCSLVFFPGRYLGLMESNYAALMYIHSIWKVNDSKWK
jgi:hypothetical protein